jgi:hypothetical protein
MILSQWSMFGCKSNQCFLKYIKKYAGGTNVFSKKKIKWWRQNLMHKSNKIDWGLYVPINVKMNC